MARRKREERRVVVVFQIPLREDADKGRRARTRRAHLGRLHPCFRWKALEGALTRTFGGFTLRKDEVLGEWFDEEQGRVVREESRVYEVDVLPGRLNEARELLRSACRTFVQKCLRVVIRGETEYLREGETDELL